MEKKMEFIVDGVMVGSGLFSIEDGKVDTANLEEEFFKCLRRNEGHFIVEAENDEREVIIDNLTSAEEDKLKEAHARDYHGTDDDMPDSYEGWLMELEYDELKEILGLK